jgi:hypothetical protein
MMPLVTGRILAVASAFMLTSCAIVPHRSKMEIPFAGTWMNSGKIEWVINRDGTYHVDVDQDGQRDSWGTMSVRGDLVQIRATGGLLHGSDCRRAGTYRYSMSGDTIRVTLVEDRCKMRRRHLAGEWRRK